MLLAQCCENDVVPFVLPFVEANIKEEMWQRRDAAVMAFGKIFRASDWIKFVKIKIMD
jgi:importin subunit beta-1